MDEVQSKGLVQPLIVVMAGGKSAGIMVDGRMICKVKMEDAVPVFMAVFYVFHIKYTEKCQNLFYALEYVFFSKPPPKQKYLAKLSRILPLLTSTS